MSKSASKNRKQAVPAKRSAATPVFAPPGMSTAQRIAWISLHVLVFVVPLAMGNWTWLPGVNLPLTFDQFDIVKVFVMRAATLVALGAWAWHILVNGGTIRRTRTDYLILVVLAWIALSTVLSVHVPTAVFGKYRRFEGLISFINYATVYFLAVQFLDRIARVRSVARTLLLSGTLVSLYGVMQYLGIDPLSWGNLPFEPNRAFSTYGNPDLLGGFLVLLLPVALGLALSEEDRIWRIAYWSGFLLAVVCWIVAFTRGAWIGGAVALVIIAIAAWRMRTRFTAVDWSFVGGIGVLGAAVVVRSLTSEYAVMNVVKRLASIFEFGEGSALTRFQIWDAAWRATLDRPIFGFGPDTFRLVFPGYKPAEYVAAAGHQSVADNVHNYFLQLTTAIGIPGMLLLYGFFVAVAVFSFRTAFVRGEDEQANDRLVLAAFWAACAGYVVHLTFGLSVTGVTVLLWLLMAALMSPGARTVHVQPVSWGMPVVAVILVLVTVMFVGNIVYIVADNRYLQGRLAPTYFEQLAGAEAAVRLNPYNDMYRAQVGIVHSDALRILVQQAQEQAQAGSDPTATLQQARQAFSNAASSLADTIAFIPLEYDNYLFITSVYNLAGQAFSPDYFDDAAQWARKGIEISEFGPGIRNQYAMALEGQGDVAGAEEQLRLAAELDPNFAEARAFLAEILLGQGDKNGAVQMIEEIQRISPEYPGLSDLMQQAGMTGAPGE